MAEDTGVDAVLRALERLPARIEEGMVIALYQEGKRILEASQPLVPVLTGLLKSTGAVETESTLGQSAVVAISYGGKGLANYAAAVHERTEPHHPVGQHHFLSQPFFEATSDMQERLTTTIRRHLGVS
jgi:hypothetical protein